MVEFSSLIKKSLRDAKPCLHGGNIWKLSEDYGFPLQEVVDFSGPVNPLGTPKKALQSVSEHLDLIKSYPDPDYKMLLTSLSDYVGAHVENIVVGCGSTQLIYLFSELFSHGDSEAIIVAPTFGEYKAALERVGAKFKLLICNAADGFKLDLEQLRRTISEKTRMIFLCNPNSPTGILHKKEEVLHVIEKAEDKGILVFLDENFVEFLDDQERFSMTELIGDFENLFVLRSFTKFFGLAGLRIGYGVTSPEISRVLRNVAMPWSVNTIAMFAAMEAIKDEEFIRESRLLVEKGRKQMQRMLRQIPWLKVYPSHTNFFLVEITDERLTSTQLKSNLAKMGVLIRDCSNFDGLNDKFFRVAVKTLEENEKLIKHMKLQSM